MGHRKIFVKYMLIGILFLTAILLMVMVYIKTRPQAERSKNQGMAEKSEISDEEADKKEISVKVIIPDVQTREHRISTDAAFLRQALDEEEMIEVKDAGFGFFITSVDGRTADESKQEWWCITKGGEEVFTGVDETPIEDGDQYELTLKTGY